MIKYDVIKKFALENPEKIAILENNNKTSWRDFEKEVSSILGYITQKEKLDKSKPILYLSNNSKELVVLSAVFATLGIPFQGIDHHLSIETLKALIKITGVKYIFLSKELEGNFSALQEICRLYQIESFVEIAKKFNKEVSADDLTPMPFSSYSFTSGTTGLPKIVYRSFSFDKQRFEYLQNTYGFNSEDIHLLCLPMHHVGTTGWARLFLGLGCTVVIGHFKTSYELCEILHSQNITTTIMSPYMLKGILEEIDGDFNADYFSSLRFLITGGKNCTPTLKKQAISKLGSIIHEYYGTTETGINTLLSSAQFIKYPGSVGTAFEGNDIIIIDEKNELVETGKIGRIAISSYMTMDRYLNYDAVFIEKNGKKYLVTSDYGYLNPEDYLFVLQRSSQPKKNVLNLYGAESDILGLSCVADVFIGESAVNSEVFINLVPKKYIPFEKLKLKVEEVAEKHHLGDVSINIVPQLEYTSTGKIKL